jgi:hypothetical protein
MTKLFNEPIIERSSPGKEQKIYRFDNGYGASVIRGTYSYGGDRGLWELAVLSGFTGGEDVEEDDLGASIDYKTPITDDVIGYLSEEDVEKILVRIKKLKPNK